MAGPLLVEQRAEQCVLETPLRVVNVPPSSSTSCWLEVDVVSDSGQGRAPPGPPGWQRITEGTDCQPHVCLPSLGC